MLIRLIENLVALFGADSDRVYLIGYSAGGDGVYKLAPRLASLFAGACMMAGDGFLVLHLFRCFSFSLAHLERKATRTESPCCL